MMVFSRVTVLIGSHHITFVAKGPGLNRWFMSHFHQSQCHNGIYPLVITAMENGPFIDGLPFKNVCDLSMAMLNNQMVVCENMD
jgi:hypothetical protein